MRRCSAPLFPVDPDNAERSRLSLDLILHLLLDLIESRADPRWQSAGRDVILKLGGLVPDSGCRARQGRLTVRLPSDFKAWPDIATGALANFTAQLEVQEQWSRLAGEVASPAGRYRPYQQWAFLRGRIRKKEGNRNGKS